MSLHFFGPRIFLACRKSWRKADVVVDVVDADDDVGVFGDGL